MMQVPRMLKAGMQVPRMLKAGFREIPDVTQGLRKVETLSPLEPESLRA